MNVGGFRRILTGALVLAILACAKTPTIVPQTVEPKPAAGFTAPLPLHQVYYPGVGGVGYRTVGFDELPQWHQQNFVESLNAFKKSCLKLQTQIQWQSVCNAAYAVPQRQQAAKHFFEYYFTPWEVSQNGKVSGLVTGYYEPVLTGDIEATAKAKYPIYGAPNDLVTVALPAFLRHAKNKVHIRLITANQGEIAENGEYIANLAQFVLTGKSDVIKGRIEGNAFVPYYTRAQINAGVLSNKAPILAYADNPIELFFLQVQGSGQLKTPQGQYLRLAYADKNGHLYVSIGKYMANMGYLPLSATSMQGIRDWINSHPERLSEILAQNPSYVFFQAAQPQVNEGPAGALGVPLTEGYSAAVDKRYIYLGAPIFLATTHPQSGFGLNRLLLAQDTGSAIQGAVRVDYFWGYGDAAGELAGKMKYTGYVWQLLPNGMLPEVR
ncbi:murein transglycosylase A [Stenoxybacter acetivorans]|uniref:murein transglycosylase A n=1 Tax=Stenoxybacter acetivorans TaxID=422441 RepID=UPI0005620116|nr:MltA domain-containing protein [Stenoxybacter acetivorans]